MEVHHGLTGCLTGVESDVVAIGLLPEMRFDERHSEVNRSQERRLLLFRCVEPGFHVATGYQEKVPGVHRKTIKKCSNSYKLSETDRIIGDSKRLLKDGFGITHTTLQVESEACGDVVCVLRPTVPFDREPRSDEPRDGKDCHHQV